MIQRPSSLTARMKDSRSWPMGLREARELRVGVESSLPTLSERVAFVKDGAPKIDGAPGLGGAPGAFEAENGSFTDSGGSCGAVNSSGGAAGGAKVSASSARTGRSEERRVGKECRAGG